MTKVKDMDKILGETCGERRIAVGYMGNKADQVAKGYDAGICRRSGGLQKDFALSFILAVLTDKVFFV